MIEHFVVPMFSILWWQGISFSAVFITIPVMLGKKLATPEKRLLGFILGIFLLLLTLSLHPIMVQKGIWNLKSSLPLQLCSISALLSGFIFFYKNQFLYELLIYWGLAGAIHSLLTPEISLGSDPFFIFEYYAAHHCSWI
jgi:hypothetical integral membrane protein (TIGR02206 family)